MAGRIRSIKPELREDIAFASLTDRSARLFPMLFTLVDDLGRCPGSPAFLAGAVFFARPCAPNVIGKAIAELVAANLIRTYEVNRAAFIEIVGWRVQGSVTHQRIDKPQPSRYPAPEWDRSENDSENTSKTDSKTDHRPQTTDLRPGPVPGPGPGSEERLSLPAPHHPLALVGAAMGPLTAKVAADRIRLGELTEKQVRDSLARYPIVAAKKDWERLDGDRLDAALAQWLLDEDPSKRNRGRGGKGTKRPDPPEDHAEYQKGFGS